MKIVIDILRGIGVLTFMIGGAALGTRLFMVPIMDDMFRVMMAMFGGAVTLILILVIVVMILSRGNVS